MNGPLTVALAFSISLITSRAGHSDHLFAWMISKLGDASGLEFLETYRPRIAEYLPRVAENLALGTAWALAREAVYWKTRESFDELLDQAESLIPGA
jgi:hypothetical protein